MKKLRVFLIIIITLLIIFGIFASYMLNKMKAQMENTDPGYWEKDVVKLIEANPKRDVDIVIYGSSSPRMWPNYQEDFAKYEVVNTSFGGSKVYDNEYYYQDLVKIYNPEVLIYWGGTNNINGGDKTMSGADTYAQFLKLYELVRNDGIELIFIPINPTKARMSVWDDAMEYNNLVKDFAAQTPGLTYVDIDGKLSGKSEIYNADYLSFDGLHLNDEGYQIVKNLVIPIVESINNQE